jgi:hypothetical protein
MKIEQSFWKKAITAGTALVIGGLAANSIVNRAEAKRSFASVKSDSLPRLNQKRDGGTDALLEAFRLKKVTSTLGLNAEQAKLLPNMVEILRETDCYRVKSPSNLDLVIRKETKDVLELLCKNAIKKIALPSGVEVRPVISSLTRNKELSKTKISAHTLGLGIDFSVIRIDVKVGGVWHVDANRRDLLLALKKSLDIELLNLHKQGVIVVTAEGNPPHTHISVMPQGQKPLPPAMIAKKPIIKVTPDTVAGKTPIIVAVPKSLTTPPMALGIPVSKEKLPTNTQTNAEQKIVTPMEITPAILQRRIEQILQKSGKIRDLNKEIIGEKRFQVQFDAKNYLDALSLTYQQLSGKYPYPKGGITEIRQRVKDVAKAMGNL